MTDIVSPKHLAGARRLKQVYSLYQQNRDLISVGAYQRGADPRIDEAIALNPDIMNFLRQNVEDAVDFPRSLNELGQLTGIRS
jgi:flagellum-specific ATP synthase